MQCQYEDLFDSCEHEAYVAVHWKRWGWTHYCRGHAAALTEPKPSDLLELQDA